MARWQDVLFEWVKHEASTRPEFRRKLNRKNINLVRNPDLDDDAENMQRLRLLTSYRTYLSLGHFTKRRWSARKFNQKELGGLILPIGIGWKYITAGTYRPQDAADTMLNKPDAIGKRYYDSLRYITRNYAKLSKTKDRLIVVGESKNDLHIVEGAHRLVAVFYRKLKEPGFRIRPMEAYVGAKSYSNWKKHHRPLPKGSAWKK